MRQDGNPAAGLATHPFSRKKVQNFVEQPEKAATLIPPYPERLLVFPGGFSHGRHVEGVNLIAFRRRANEEAKERHEHLPFLFELALYTP